MHTYDIGRNTQSISSIGVVSKYVSYDGVCIHTVHIGRNTIEYILSIAALSKYMSNDGVCIHTVH